MMMPEIKNETLLSGLLVFAKPPVGRHSNTALTKNSEHIIKATLSLTRRKKSLEVSIHYFADNKKSKIRIQPYFIRMPSKRTQRL